MDNSYQVPELDRPRTAEETAHEVRILGLHERRCNDCFRLEMLGAMTREQALGEMVLGLYRDKEYHRKIALQYMNQYGTADLIITDALPSGFID